MNDDGISLFRGIGFAILFEAIGISAALAVWYVGWIATP